MQTYLMLAAIGLAIAVVYKLFDQWRDNRQKAYQDIGDSFSLFGQDEFAAAFKALARDDNEEFVSKLKSLSDRLRRPGGVAEVLTTIIVKSINDTEFMADPQVESRLKPVLVNRMLGFVIDESIETSLVPVASKMSEFGMKDSSALVMALASKKFETARMSLHSLVSKFRDPEQIDDVLMEVAKKAVPKLMKDPAHANTLLELVNGNGAVGASAVAAK